VIGRAFRTSGKEKRNTYDFVGKGEGALMNIVLKLQVP
jgi:hypothetical protein